MHAVSIIHTVYKINACSVQEILKLKKENDPLKKHLTQI